MDLNHSKIKNLSCDTIDKCKIPLYILNLQGGGWGGCKDVGLPIIQQRTGMEGEVLKSNDSFHIFICVLILLTSCNCYHSTTQTEKKSNQSD